MKQGIEIIYFDIDGTLRDEQKGIPESAVLAINQCYKQGIRIVICTGRSLRTIQDDVMALPKDGVISGGGCSIQYHGQEIRKNYFSADTVKGIVSSASLLQLSLAVETEENIFMDALAAGFYREDFEHKMNGKKNSEELWAQNKIFYEDNFKDLKNAIHKVHKICILGEQSAVYNVAKKFGREAEIIQKKKWNDRWYLELLPKGCHKGSAVRILNRRLGIPKSRSISFGDSENDIAMMKATGIPVAVESGDSRIRKYAASICEPVMEDGIYKELIRRNIIKPLERSTVNEAAVVAGRGCLSNLSQELL